MYFIDVILPIPLKQTFTYSVNKDEAAFLKPGMRVAIPFGKSKVYTGIVFQVHDLPPVGYETKSIDHILDETPIITSQQLNHWEWIAKYYMCSLGEVIKAALPSAFLLESETIIKLSSEKESDESSLTDEEFLVFEALQHQSSLHINDVRSILDKKNVVSVIQKLIEKGIVTVEETVYEQYTPKLKRYIKLSQQYTSEENLRELLETLTRAPKQRDVLMNLFMLNSQTKKPISSTELQKKSEASAATLKSLIDKGILEEYFIQHDRVEFSGEASSEIKTLNEAQTKAYEEIKISFAEKDVVLLHGVTSSGKTEIYVRLIEKMIASGKQVLYMLPEIALTTQLISRLQKYFGEKISVYHSKFSVNERVEVWKNVLAEKAKAQIVIGARSSLFLPFKNLGFIIVDEEHEPSFKQYSPSPRYNARDSAIVLANLHNAKLLMGSATPSLESYHNAKTGKFGLVTLKKRFGNVMMPEIELVDIKEKGRKKQMTGHFSDRLLEEMYEVLRNGEQIILFQNRRGFSPVVECTTCGVSPQCPNCDVSLTFHQHKNQLRCHYCGYNMAMMQSCIACGSETLDTKGFGTEQIETELKSLFPNQKIARMDQDTTKGKHSYSKLIDALENEEIDILVGTQMLAKGLDFRNISLVGVMNADNLLNFPDFRAHERSFQLLQQVSGRAGRTKKRGKVLIQTYNPYHQILKQVSVNDYEEMYKEQLEERYNYKYPPFYKTIKIIFKDKNLNRVQKASTWFGQALEMQFKENILGPEPPPIGRIKNKYIINLLIKIPKKQSLDKTKRYIENVQRSFNAIKEFSSVRVNLDVDNY
ncbi:replication restart DNA helicase PriA [Aequorivita sublithincola DSM 14238]|uniref:Replication restart protein PriA n=1 Tax=Aequorivita sublithincola (strain DSM 14238 / LMG 21431 / ACAM 643 / 9-3) TaxID=746697 RepID=I3YXY7_AEQSU|nr:primosomal protein N' [Aequorivita sublithincola]AFL81855.1 replication restart DNA helicase PriA [Aequorivita sublithincola DSM 14238]